MLRSHALWSVYSSSWPFMGLLCTWSSERRKHNYLNNFFLFSTPENLRRLLLREPEQWNFWWTCYVYFNDLIIIVPEMWMSSLVALLMIFLRRMANLSLALWGLWDILKYNVDSCFQFRLVNKNWAFLFLHTYCVTVIEYSLLRDLHGIASWDSILPITHLE